MFAPDESPVDSLTAMISLQSLLSNQGYNLGNVSLVMETTLGANQWINVNDISPPEFYIILKDSLLNNYDILQLNMQKVPLILFRIVFHYGSGLSTS